MDTNRKYFVTLTEEERTQLHAFLNKGVTHGRQYTRAQILLLADETQATDQAIARVLHTSPDTVGRTRKKCVDGGVTYALTERPRPGAKRLLDRDLEQVVIALACSDPPPGHADWTMQLLADKLVEGGLVERISDETVRRTLKKIPPSPGRTRRG